MKINLDKIKDMTSKLFSRKTILILCYVITFLLLALILLPYFHINTLTEHVVETYLSFFQSIGKKEVIDQALSSNSIIVDESVNYGANGDSFGVINPFIALLAAMLTFIAFFVQYNANIKMQMDNKKQQTERQFYEMLRIRQESLNTLTLDAPAGTNGELKKIHGQEVFSTLRREFDLIFKIVNYKFPSKNEAFEKAYAIFFWGFKSKSKNADISYIIKELICDSYKDANNNNLKLSRDTIITTNYSNISNTIYDAQKLFCNANDFAAGRINILDPYYRHLYFMVKTIACSKSFENSKDEKNEKTTFLKLLRAQMTSDEQILLLYNWHSKLGKKWESSEENQFFFTEWEMIHNIFPENCVFNKQEILNLFPNASDKQKAEMFEHIKP